MLQRKMREVRRSYSQIIDALWGFLYINF